MSAVTAKWSPWPTRVALPSSAAVADVPTAATTASVADTRALLVGGQFASATEVALVDESRFVGVVPIERLASAADLVRIGDLAEEAVVTPPEPTSTRLPVPRRDAAGAVSPSSMTRGDSSGSFRAHASCRSSSWSKRSNRETGGW